MTTKQLVARTILVAFYGAIALLCLVTVVALWPIFLVSTIIAVPCFLLWLLIEWAADNAN